MYTKWRQWGGGAVGEVLPKCGTSAAAVVAAEAPLRILRLVSFSTTSLVPAVDSDDDVNGIFLSYNVLLKA